MQKMIRIGAALLALVGLSACDPALQPSSPKPIEKPVVEPTPYVPSERSIALRNYYNSVQQSLLIQGLMRTDGGGPDTPFNKRQLVENFIQVGVYNEFTLVNGRYTNARSEGKIQRWTVPVIVSLTHGDSVPVNQVSDNRREVNGYLRKLSRTTGHPISAANSSANFHVAVLDVDELATYGPTLQAQVPGLTAQIAAQITDMPRDIYCAVYAFSEPDNPDEFVKAVAIVRSEHPDLLRKSCFHEEIAQGLGLSNDSPAARPSIFNDDDEFALLTRHDELLLKILYDQRLPLGIGPSAARPVVEVIASELLGGES
jgi:hypothetical protein